MPEKCPKCSGSLIVTPVGNAVCEGCSYKRVATQKDKSESDQGKARKAAPQRPKAESAPPKTPLVQASLKLKKYTIEFLDKDGKVLASKKHSARDLVGACSQSVSMYFVKHSTSICVITADGEKIQFLNPSYSGEESFINTSGLPNFEELKEGILQRKQEEEQRKQEEEQRKQEEERRKQEEEQRKQDEIHQDLVKSLGNELSLGRDYYSLSTALRSKAELFFIRILQKDISDWSNYEADIVRIVSDFPKRADYHSLMGVNFNGEMIDSQKKIIEILATIRDQHKPEDVGNNLILAELKELNQRMKNLLEGQGKQIDMSIDNRNAAKIGIAAHLLTGGTAGAVARGIEDAFDSDDE
ncbi:MAG: hypothetical protein ACPGQC_13810 [Limisphaerales bacterium]